MNSTNKNVHQSLITGVKLLIFKVCAASNVDK